MRIIQAKKNLGQNFLTDTSSLLSIANAVPVQDSNIVEIWPWYGALTAYILDQDPRHLDLIEIDGDMIEILSDRIMHWDFSPFADKISIQHKDVLQYIPSFQKYKIIANIPYYITAPILFYFLYSPDIIVPSSMVIMMQLEVGKKIMAWRSKKSRHSALSLSMELACEDISVVCHVDRQCFDPIPKVDSIVLKFIPKKDRQIDIEKQLFWLWKKAFAHPRKTLVSNIKSSCISITDFVSHLNSLGYNDRIRAEAIKKDDWISFLTFLK